MWKFVAILPTRFYCQVEVLFLAYNAGFCKRHQNSLDAERLLALLLQNGRTTVLVAISLVPLFWWPVVSAGFCLRSRRARRPQNIPKRPTAAPYPAWRPFVLLEILIQVLHIWERKAAECCHQRQWTCKKRIADWPSSSNCWFHIRRHERKTRAISVGRRAYQGFSEAGAENWRKLLVPKRRVGVKK